EESKYILFKKASDMSNVYYRIDTLGSSYSSEFSYGSVGVRSIFPENKALIAPEESKVKIVANIPDFEITSTNGEAWETTATVQLGFQKPAYRGKDFTGLVGDMANNTMVPQSIRMLAERFASILGALNNPLSAE